jgi:hypothetical protein
VPYQPLAQRLATLPLVICGPVLRRVTPTSVTVFVALREPRDVMLKVYDVAANGAAGAERCPRTATTVAIGDNLHVLAITATGALQPGSTYVYDGEPGSSVRQHGLDVARDYHVPLSNHRHAPRNRFRRPARVCHRGLGRRPAGRSARRGQVCRLHPRTALRRSFGPI